MNGTKFRDDTEEDAEEDDEDRVQWETGDKFSHFIVWEHHSLSDAKQDNWVRGIKEWISMAEVVVLVLCVSNRRWLPQGITAQKYRSKKAQQGS